MIINTQVYKKSYQHSVENVISTRRYPAHRDVKFVVETESIGEQKK